MIDQSLASWLPVLSESDFPIQNLPFGLLDRKNSGPRACTRIGDTIIDLFELASANVLLGWDHPAELFNQPSLNQLVSLGNEASRKLRGILATLFSDSNSIISGNATLRAAALLPAEGQRFLLPIQAGDYTDFYSSIEHATNVGIMFRDPTNALLPNWKHIPVGYHGRSSSIVVSGTEIRRPKGQMRPDDNAPPVFGPSKQLDFELEVAFVVGRGNDMGTSIPVAESEDHIFGIMLFNDWSARDIQKWEYVPLGPFLGKNFASSISPWIITLDALEPFRVDGPVQDPQPLPYLQVQGAHNFDIELEVWIEPEKGSAVCVSRSNFKYMYWNMAQQLAHHTVNGCNMRPGDICASGTISGPDPGSFGSMLEIAWKGTKPVPMPDGSERKFILDGDTVCMRGFAKKGNLRVGLGEVRSKVIPSLP